MIKNEKGITLIALIITIAVLMILLLITVGFSRETLSDVANDRTMTELSNVQQAIFQQYVILKTYNNDGKIPESTTNNVDMENDLNRPSQLVGTRIVKMSILEQYGFSTYKQKYSNTMSYEEYYYIIDKQDLKEMGMTVKNLDNADLSYIVNYSTGEVFDLVNKIYINEYDSTLEEDAILTGTGNTLKVEQQQYDFTE